MTELLLIGALVAAGMYLKKKQNHPLAVQPGTSNIPQSFQSSYVAGHIAFVKAENGAQLFSGTGTTDVPGFGYGRDLIMKLPVNTTLGSATGGFQNGMLELSTTINLHKIKFWVAVKEIALVPQKEYENIKSSQLLPKSDDAKMKLLKA